MNFYRAHSVIFVKKIYLYEYFGYVRISHCFYGNIRLVGYFAFDRCVSPLFYISEQAIYRLDIPLNMF